MTCSLVGGLAVPSYASTPKGTTQSTAEQQETADIWVNAKDGKRTFNVEGDSLVPNLVEGDSLKVEGNTINTYNSAGELVASIEADVPEGVHLMYVDGVITAHDTSADQSTNDGFASSAGYNCIDNKWVSFGLTAVADGLVCAPLGVATGGVGGFACGVAVGAGITALSC